MNYRTMVNRKLIAALVCCIGLIAGMAAAAQLAPVYAGSHSTQGSKDVGSITVNNKTTYYDDVDDLLDDLEEYDECTVKVDMLKNWYMGEDCRWIEICSGDSKNRTKVTFDMHAYTIDRNIPDGEDDDDYLVFNIGKYVDMTIEGGWQEWMDTKCFTGNGYGGGWDSTYYYKGGGIVGGRFNESIWSSPKGGSGIFLASNSNLTLKNVTLGGCKSFDGEGGGVYVDSHSTLNMINSSIRGCQTTDDGGGGVYMAEGSTLNMDNSEISNNGSYDEGGGILIKDENVTVNMKRNSKIEGNRATDSGGGIAVLNDKCVIHGDDSISCSIKENRATYNTTVDSRHNGGGVYIENPGEITNLKIEGNKTDYGNGGGLFLASDKLTSRHYLVENCIFEMNDAVDKTTTLTCSEGGGLYVDDNGTEIRNCSFSYNTAYNAGGGLYVNAEDVKLIDCLFKSNDSDGGSGNYSYQGGGAYINGTNPIFQNCQFTNNYARKQGGGVFVDKNNGVYDCARFTGKTIIRDNTAGDSSVVRVQENNLYIDTDDFVQFHDLKTGSRVYLGSGGFESNKWISDYTNRTVESEKKYLTLEDDDPSMVLDYTLSEKYNVSLRIMKKGPLNHLVGFDSKGGSYIDEQTVADSKTAEEPKAPVKEDAVFTGWYTGDTDDADAQLWDFNNSVYEDMTLHARWFNGYKVSFSANGGTGTMDPVYKLPGEYTLPECEFTAPIGRIFDCWEIKGGDGSRLQPGDEILITDKPIELYAMWKDIPAEVSVTLVANNGTDDSKTVTASPGDYTLPECVFDAPEYKAFAGWSLTEDGNVISDSSIRLDHDINLYAIWTDKEKEIPEYEVPTGLEGKCGQMLESIELPEGFVWQDKNRRIRGTEDTAFLANFIPKDTDRYQIVEDIEIEVSVEHNYKKTDVAPTCEGYGYTFWMCEECESGGIDYNEDPLGHDWGEDTPFGHSGIQHTCLRCGTTEIVKEDTEEHHFDTEYTVDKPASFENDGSKSRHCTDEGCDAVESSTIIPAVAQIKLSQYAYDYDGEAKTPEVKVTNRASENNVLVEGTDYDVVYPDDCTSAGTKTLTIALKGEYEGKKDVTYEIYQASIVRQHPELSKKQFTYTGKEIKPEVKMGELAEGKDFEVSYSDNVKVGTATVTITGIGNFVGTTTKTFTIDQASLTGKTVKLGYTKAVYTGKERKPSVSIDGLTKGKDFTVSYRYNKKVGKASVVITGKDNCTGKITKTFKIVPKKAGVKYVTRGKGKLTVTMSTSAADKGGSRYQIAYKQKGTKTWKYKTTKYRKAAIKKLKKGKRYYVKVRAYRIVNHVKYSGSWSKVKLSKKIR